ncbi:MAG: glycosyltransferase [Anaerolineales bacterium]|nr:glycosyltransferase [Anaerolineales bacterium]
MHSVSVIIPAYQSSRTIRETLESVFAQSIPVAEVIVIDDGSTDGLEEALQPFISKIILLKQKNLGAAAARNYGIKHSSGDIIAFLDSDDTWLPEKLALQLLLFNNQRVGVVFGNVIWRYQGILQKKTYFDLFKPERGHVFLSLFVLDYVPMLSVLARRHMLEQVGLFDESIRNVEDYDLLLRMAQVCEFDYVQDPVAVYRISSQQISKKFIQAAAALLRLKENTYRLNLAAFQGVDQKILERGLYNKYLKLALCYMREEKTKAAGQTLDGYFQVRGISAIYLAFRCVLSLPEPLMRLIIRLWDKVYQKPELGFY